MLPEGWRSTKLDGLATFTSSQKIVLTLYKI
jgi:hypothetical protein